MAGKTNTEKIDEISKSVYTLNAYVDMMRAEIASISPLSARVAILEREVVDLKKHHDNLITRLWMIGVPLIVTLLGGILTAPQRK